MLQSSVIYLIVFLTSLQLFAQEWQSIEVDFGVKPAIAVNSGGAPEISYILESNSGWVRHASWNEQTSEFQIAEVSLGYFYGPLDVVLDHDDNPHISFHDHGTEDQIHAWRENQLWTNQNISDPGHDGWDNRIVIDSNNYPRTSTVDPGGSGVEYAWYDGAEWHVEQIGSGDIPYQFATSIALDSQDRPHITYFNVASSDLMYASKMDGEWEIVAIDTAGDVGRFADLVIDSDDNPHISYYEHFGSFLLTAGQVKYMHHDGQVWERQIIDTLNAVSLTFSGARNITSIALNSLGNPCISYADAEYVYYAVNDGSGSWAMETALDYTGQEDPLGQLSSLRLDAEDRPHISTFVATRLSPLEGNVLYLTREPLVGVTTPSTLPDQFALGQNYPNPFNPETVIRYSLFVNSSVSLDIYNLAGQRIRQLAGRRGVPAAIQPAGTYEVTWDGSNDAGEQVASGLYFYRLAVQSAVPNLQSAMRRSAMEQTRKMILLR